jgi:hypothetical protein
VECTLTIHLDIAAQFPQLILIRNAAKKKKLIHQDVKEVKTIILWEVLVSVLWDIEEVTDAQLLPLNKVQHKNVVRAVAQWARSGHLPREAAQWARSGHLPREAAQWARSGHLPREAAQCARSGHLPRGVNWPHESAIALKILEHSPSCQGF